MLHSVWLQNRTSTRALDGKTPYEMATGVKPHLAGIQEFGAAAYVKDLTAGKLDARARKGRFVGYDAESKAYQIYFPEHRIVSVERDVTFNPDDSHVLPDKSVSIPDDVLDEGEADKVIQPEVIQPEAIQPSDPVIKEPIEELATGDLTPKPRDVLPDP